MADRGRLPGVDNLQVSLALRECKPIGFDNFARAVTELGCYWVLMNKPPY
jgi:hypothetical protein